MSISKMTMMYEESGGAMTNSRVTFMNYDRLCSTLLRSIMLISLSFLSDSCSSGLVIEAEVVLDCNEDQNFEICQQSAATDGRMEIPRILTNTDHIDLTWDAIREASAYIITLASTPSCSIGLLSTQESLSASVRIPLPDDGIFYACVSSVLNGAKNLPTANYIFQIVYDTSPPTLQFSRDNPKLYNAPFIIDKISEDLTNIRYVWQKKSGPDDLVFDSSGAAEPSISAATDGAYEVRLLVKDELGYEAEDTFTFTWDTTNPTAPSEIQILEGQAHNGLYLTSTFQSGVDKHLKSNIAKACESQDCSTNCLGEVEIPKEQNLIVLEGLEDGKSYYSCVRTIDLLNQSSEFVASDLPVEIKFQAPVFTTLDLINEAQDGYINAQDHSLSNAIGGNLVASGYDTVEYALVAPGGSCDAELSGFASEIPMTNSAVFNNEGSYFVCVRLSDTAGNVTFGESETFVFDANAPVNPSIAINEGSHTNSSTINLSLSAADAAKMYITNSSGCSADGNLEDYATSKSTWTHGVSNGLATVYVKFIDMAANESPCISASITHDDIPPTVTLSSSADNTNNLSEVPVVASFSELVTGFEEEDISVTNGSVKASSLQDEGDGSYSFVILPASDGVISVGINGAAAIDAANNQSDALLNGLSFNSDRTPPSISIDLPQDGASAKEYVTLQGSCEVGFGLNFGGSGILSAITGINCTDGSYSQQVYFSAGEGQKTLSVSSQDALGNIATVERTYIRDQSPPTFTISSPSSLLVYTQSESTELSGTCESPQAVSYLLAVDDGPQSAPVNITCSSGSYSENLSLSGEATYVYSLSHKDEALNVSTKTLTIVKDQTPPVLTFSDGSDALNVTTAYDSHTFSGVCESSSSVAVASMSVSGSGLSEPETFDCSTSSWSFTVPLQSADAIYTYTFTQTDKAGNNASIIGTWERLASIPEISLYNPMPTPASSDQITFTGSCDIETPKMANTDITVSGQDTQTISCDGGSFSYQISSQGSDGSYSYTFSQTTATSLTSSVTGTFTRDTAAPLISSFAIDEGSSVSRYRISVSVTAEDSGSNITNLCLKSELWADESTEPATPSEPSSTDSCWKLVSAPPISQTPAKSLSISAYGFTLPLVPGKYSVYGFIKDQAGNASALSAASTILSIPEPVAGEIIAITDANGSVQSDFLPGQDLQIHWSAEDSNPLPSDAISLAWSTDLTNWNTIATSLANEAFEDCSPYIGATGCYSWSMPTDSSMTIRLTVTNSLEQAIENYSVPLNTENKIKVIAGKTSRGLSYDARSYILSTANEADGRFPHANQFVVDRKGIIYIIDNKEGIVKVSPTDQVADLKWVNANYSGDGELTDLTSFKDPARLYIDRSFPSQRLFVLESSGLLRMLDLKAGTVTTLNQVNSETLSFKSAIDIHATSDGIYAWLIYTDPTAVYQMDDGTEYTYEPQGLFYLNEETLKWEPYIFDRSSFEIISKNNEATLGEFMNVRLPSRACDRGNHRVPFLDENGKIYRFNLYINSGNNASSPTYPCVGNYLLNITHSPDRSIALSEHVSATTIPSANAIGSDYDSWPFLGLDGKSYHWIRKSINMVYRYDQNTNTWDLLLGKGGGSNEASCPDGTLASECDPQLYAIFVDENGTLFFHDKGRIRLIDNSGKIATIIGNSPKLYDPSIGAKNLALGGGMERAIVKRWVNAGEPEYVFSNFPALSYQGVSGDTVKLLAGDGTKGEPSLAISSSNTPAPMLAGYTGAFTRQFALNTDNGEIYASRGGDLVRLDRSSSSYEWKTLIPNTCTENQLSYADSSHDSTPNQAVCLDPINTNKREDFITDNKKLGPVVLGYDDGDLILQHGDAQMFNSDSTEMYLKDYWYSHNVGLFSVRPSSYDSLLETVFGLKFFMGTRDYHNYTSGSSNIYIRRRSHNTPVDSNALDAKLTINLLAGTWPQTYQGIQRYGGEWHFIESQDAKNLKRITSDGMVRLVTTTSSSVRNFVIVTENSNAILYYCDSNTIKRKDITANSPETALDLKVNGLKCSGMSMDYFEEDGNRYLLNIGYLNDLYIIYSYKLD